MGLAGFAESTGVVGVGQDRASAGRVAGAFREVACSVNAGEAVFPVARPKGFEPPTF